MIESFRIKEALCDIGKKNKTYFEIFKYYESLERQLEALQKKYDRAMKQLGNLSKEMEAQGQSMSAALAESQQEVKSLSDELKARIEELERLKMRMSRGGGAQGGEDLSAEIEKLRQEMADALREKEEQWTTRTKKLQEDYNELKLTSSKERDAHQNALDRLRKEAEQEKAPLLEQIEAQARELERKDQEIAAMKNNPTNYDGLTKSKLAVLAPKKGWNVKMLPYFVGEETVDIEALQKQMLDAVKRVEALEEERRASGGFGNANASEIQEMLAVERRQTAKLKGEIEPLRKENATLKSQLHTEREENRRRQTQIEEFMSGDGSNSGEVVRLREENQQLKVAIEELRFRLSKLENLVKRSPDGAKAMRSMIDDAGLGLGAGMQEWLLQNVFERLYNDALARHKRFEERWIAAQEAWAESTYRKKEIYHIGGSIARHFLQPSAAMPQEIQKELHTQLMNWANVVYPQDDEIMLAARMRVHELLAQRAQTPQTAQCNVNLAADAYLPRPQTDPGSRRPPGPQSRRPQSQDSRRGHNKSAASSKRLPTVVTSQQSWQTCPPSQGGLPVKMTGAPSLNLRELEFCQPLAKGLGRTASAPQAAWASMARPNAVF